MAEHTIYLAGGCFWGVEKYLSQIEGVKSTVVGYANGESENPSYEDVCASSGHAETVKTVFDDDVISLSFLLDMFYKAIDPLSVNRQGGDIGIQYRTGIYYTDINDRQIIERSLQKLSDRCCKKTAVECIQLQNFYEAEEYHQNYLTKNPDGYCHISNDKFLCAADTVPPSVVLDRVKNAFNLRDLGGYGCTINGKPAHTEKGVFWRCDSTARLTYKECQMLKDSGLTTVVDLRSPHEIASSPSAFADFDGIDYKVVSMLDNINSAVSAADIPDDLGKMYCAAIKNGSSQAAELIDIFSKADGTVLFNCTAGKDRTGVVAMLLLDLAGVSADDIVIDYIKTEERIKPIIELQVSQLKKLNTAIPEKLLHAEKESAEVFLKYLYEQYGGARQYLKSQSVSDEALDGILFKFVCED